MAKLKSELPRDQRRGLARAATPLRVRATSPALPELFSQSASLCFTTSTLFSDAPFQANKSPASKTRSSPRATALEARPFLWISGRSALRSGLLQPHTHTGDK